ncbi:hypothetical protein CSAL01_00443 [Colletotrichum salicis]|uniref:Nephrocystin 3-like N-terminal domain-containing protein n=1 Tax=Colletotrichum salicis TaxID=1209931 RepID=A0A135V9A1_9PEZI|nr:hypothetical protein CSAL01_00443 [Colletotrichum salicis]
MGSFIFTFTHLFPQFLKAFQAALVTKELQILSSPQLDSATVTLALVTAILSSVADMKQSYHLRFGISSINPSRSDLADISRVGELAKDEMRRCIDALFITNPDIDKQEILDSSGGIVEGTCQWIRSEDKYRTWLESGKSELLCISGAPGMGKTMLPIFLIGELKDLTQRSPGTLVFHFCNRHDPRRNTAISILRTWLHEIFTTNPVLAKHAAKFMLPRERIEYTLGSLGTLWQIFAHVLEDPDLGPFYCILDGLDECLGGDRKWLVGKLQALFERPSGVCRRSPNISKFIILSGGIEGVRGSHYLNLDQCSGRKQRALNPGLVYMPFYSGQYSDDISLVIDARLAKHPNVEEFDKGFWGRLRVKLYERSEGLFSWAGFMLDELTSKKSESEMWKTLDKMPRGLRPAYSRLLSQTCDESREEIASMVRWMAVAQEPFTARQLSTALYPDKQHSDEEEDEACKRIQDLVTDSYPLMRFTKGEEEDLCVTYDKGDFVVLFHRSMIDYLSEIDINDANVDSKIKTCHLAPEKSHYEIAKRCLDDLQAQFERPENIARGFKYYWTDHKFCVTMWLKYARSHWATHARLCGEESLKFMKPRHAFFEEESILRTAWWLEYDPDGIMKDDMRWATRRVCSMFGVLQICSALGLLPIICKLLEESSDVKDYVNDTEVDSHTALAYATHYKQSEAAELLVRSGASLVNGGQEIIPYLTVECPLVNTFRWGNTRLAALFLKLACTEMKDEPYDRRVASFNLICEAPNQEFVLMVMEHMNSEDINIEFGNVLSEALSWHSHQVAKLKCLCRRVRSSPCKVWCKDDSKYDTFLNVVCFAVLYPDVVERPDSIVRRFLLDGVDVNGDGASWSHGWTALHLIAAFGNDNWWTVEIAQDLLAHGARVNAVIEKYKRCINRLCQFPGRHSHESQTASDFALIQGNSGVLSVLKKGGGLVSATQQESLTSKASKRKRDQQ